MIKYKKKEIGEIMKCKYLHKPDTVDEVCLKWGCFYYNLTCFFKADPENCDHYEV